MAGAKENAGCCFGIRVGTVYSTLDLLFVYCQHETRQSLGWRSFIRFAPPTFMRPMQRAAPAETVRLSGSQVT